MFQFDLHQVTPLFHGEYCHELNSDDLHDTELGLIRNRAHGGTMVLWRRSLDKFISVLPCTTSSFLPILFSYPGCPATLHVALYLPTSGRESQFVEEISKLRAFLEEYQEIYPDHHIYIRGDSNVNSNHSNRMKIFRDFISTLLLKSSHIPHKTYHHFVGLGNSDSDLDHILYSSKLQYQEILQDIYCKLSEPLIDSHHDMIISSWSLPDVTT